MAIESRVLPLTARHLAHLRRLRQRKGLQRCCIDASARLCGRRPDADTQISTTWWQCAQFTDIGRWCSGPGFRRGADKGLECKDRLGRGHQPGDSSQDVDLFSRQQTTLAKACGMGRRYARARGNDGGQIKVVASPAWVAVYMKMSLTIAVASCRTSLLERARRRSMKAQVRELAEALCDGRAPGYPGLGGNADPGLTE